MAKAVTNSLTKKRRRVSDIVLKALIFISSGIVVALTLGMIIYIAVKGAEGMSLNFLTTPAFSYPRNACRRRCGNISYRIRKAGQTYKNNRIHCRNACRHPLNHIRTFRQCVLLQYLQSKLLTAYRCADIVNNGTAHHNPYHAGSDKDRSYGIQRGCCRTWRT